jgi:hypothetical protein
MIGRGQKASRVELLRSLGVPQAFATLAAIIKKRRVVRLEREGGLKIITSRYVITALEEIDPIVVVSLELLLLGRHAAQERSQENGA